MEPQSGNGFTWYWTPETWAWNPADGPWQPKYGAPVDHVYLEVSSSGAAPRHQYDFWRQFAFYNFDPDLPSDEQKTSFLADANSFYSRRAQLHTYRSDAISGRRTRKQASADSGALIDIGFIVSGHRLFTPDVASRRPIPDEYGAGDFFVYDPSRYCRTQWQAHEGLHLTFERSTLEAVCGGSLPDIDALVRTLNTSRLAPFLRSQLLLLSQKLPMMTMAERLIVTENAVDLLFALLQTGEAAVNSPQDPIGHGLFVAAQRYVDAQLANAALSAQQIAHAVGCSRATLYRVFADEGLTVGQYVRERRLSLALHLLQEAPDVTVAAVAHRCGFGDISHFSKLFKRTYGMRPTDARRPRSPEE